jgi:hypothetical protein
VKYILLKHLHQFLEPSTNSEPNMEFETTNLEKAHRLQTLIGWRHFIRGRLTIEWGKIIDNHLSKEKLHKITAEKWAADLFMLNWKHILSIWRERCIDMHGNNQAEIEINTKNRCLDEIRYIQSINPNLNNSNYEWLHEDIEALRNHTSKQLQTWLYGAKIISRDNQQSSIIIIIIIDHR